MKQIKSAFEGSLQYFLVVVKVDSLKPPVHNESTSSCNLLFNAIDYEKYKLEDCSFIVK